MRNQSSTSHALRFSPAAGEPSAFPNVRIRSRLRQLLRTVLSASALAPVRKEGTSRDRTLADAIFVLRHFFRRPATPLLHEGATPLQLVSGSSSGKDRGLLHLLRRCRHRSRRRGRRRLENPVVNGRAF
jgi:hypothetical protein